MNELFEPVPTILSRKIEHEPTRKELASYAEAIDDIVSIGTHLLNWELNGDINDSISEDEVVQVGVTFKRLLEILDSIALQVEVGAVSTAVIQLRVLFELGVQFEHLLMEDTQRRCYSMMLTDWYRKLEELNKIPVGNRSSEEIASIKALNILIGRPEVNAIKSEYDRVRTNKRKGEIKWYNLFEPTLIDFSKLIAHKFSKYDMHYKAINKGFGNDAVHSTNLLTANYIHEAGITSIIQMRNSQEAIGVAGIAFYIGRTCCELYKERRSNEKKSQCVRAIMNCEKRHKEIAFAGLHNMKISK